ncbi:hypothetical protein PENPOL_c015G00363 [Penicillium polonicum]|uniref:Uncharacterized protein n=1 Tax=Penicillium polonicum TaxID=60169 RepID=A0A1V6NAC1_PENPO|nr:hypothetical protein PENPOL_c015G00363 [Penicillium polonicum]
MGINYERSSSGGPILGGICTVCLSKTVLADKDAVLVDVAVVISARLILRARAFPSLPVRPREEKGESVVAELVRLAEEKGGAVMNSVATNLIWMVVVCVFALKGILFFYWFVQRLCDRYVPRLPYPVQESTLKYNVAGFPRRVLLCPGGRFVFEPLAGLLGLFVCCARCALHAAPGKIDMLRL